MHAQKTSDSLDLQNIEDVEHGNQLKLFLSLNYVVKSGSYPLIYTYIHIVHVRQADTHTLFIQHI